MKNLLIVTAMSTCLAGNVAAQSPQTTPPPPAERTPFRNSSLDGIVVTSTRQDPSNPLPSIAVTNQAPPAPAARPAISLGGLSILPPPGSPPAAATEGQMPQPSPLASAISLPQTTFQILLKAQLNGINGGQPPTPEQRTSLKQLLFSAPAGKNLDPQVLSRLEQSLSFALSHRTAGAPVPPFLSDTLGSIVGRNVRPVDFESTLSGVKSALLSAGVHPFLADGVATDYFWLGMEIYGDELFAR